MRIIDEITNQEVENPDLEAGYLYGGTYVSPEAYASIDNEEKFALADEDYEPVQFYHTWTDEEMARREREQKREKLMDALSDAFGEEYIQSDKIGSVWRVVKLGEVEIMREYVPDPDYNPDQPDGTYLKPYPFEQGMTVEVGLWYTDGEDIWECIEGGAADGFTAPWFDVIA